MAVKITKEIIDDIKDELELLKLLEYKTYIDMDFLNIFMERVDENKKIIKPKYRFSDKIKLSPYQEKLFNVSETTIGRLIFNSFCLPKAYFEKFEYINSPVNGNIYENVHDNLALLLTNKKISADDYTDTINRFSWIGCALTNFKGYTMDLDSLTVPKDFKSKRDKVYKDLKNGNASNKEILNKEDELLSELKKHKSDSGLYKIINIGAKGSFGNNYKNLLIGRGIINNLKGESELLTTDLTSGNKTAEYVKLANNSVVGTFGRSLKTAQGGYLTKLVSAGFSYLEVSDEEDCGTNILLHVKLTSSNIKNFLNRYITESKNSKVYIELTLDNYKKYVNKDVYLRSPMFCRSTSGICRKCYGSLIEYNKLNKGLNVLIADLTSKIMNKSMKSFHDLTVKYFSVDLTKYI